MDGQTPRRQGTVDEEVWQKKKIGNKPQMTDIYEDHMYNSSQGAVAPQGDGDDQTSRFIYKLY